MMKIGFLGANGFVGSRATEMLHLGGEFEIVPIVRSVSGLARVARFGVEWRVADALSVREMTSAFAQCDVVVHAIAGSLEAIKRSPIAALKAAQSAGVRRIVYISTASVHGQDPAPGTDEDSPLHTHHLVPYNNAKVIAERKFLRHHESFGVELVVLRPGIVFGPRDAWVSSIVRALLEGSAYLVDGGRGYCNSIYVDNLVHALCRSITADVNAQVFLVGDQGALTWSELYHWIASSIGSDAEIPSVRAPDSFARTRSVLDRIKEIPGAQACVDRIPRRAKRFVRRQFENVASVRQCLSEVSRARVRNPWRNEANSLPSVSIETALLHRCRHRFDYARARDVLGFVPPTSLYDGLNRTIGWLRSIGYL